jgi:thiol-disulfide isomerase/thioredoxin
LNINFSSYEKNITDCILIDYNNRSIALKDLKNKVLIIEFTGIGCVPCHAPTPLIKQLVTDYKDKDLGFICIETWSSDIEGLKRYHKNNELNYNLLKGNEETIKSYQVNGVPSFFILDKNGIIRKAIQGYEERTTIRR